MRRFVNVRGKYGAAKIDTTDGRFDSGLEYKRWLYLKQMQAEGRITGLVRQVPYILIPKQYDENGKLIFRELKYISDFEYTDVSTGEKIVEDTKGIILPIFKVKQKLMYYIFGIKVTVVRKW